MARKAISSSMDCDRPDNADPARKMMIAATKNFFRPYMAPSLPQNGVVIVDARM